VRTIFKGEVQTRRDDAKLAETTPTAGFECNAFCCDLQVLIGLTVLAYRYEGLRKPDLRRVIERLKQRLRMERGPMPARPARALFDGWIAAAQRRREQEAAAAGSGSDRCVPNREITLIQSALQHLIFGVWSSALGMSWIQLLFQPYPKKSVNLTEMTPTAHFE